MTCLKPMAAIVAAFLPLSTATAADYRVRVGLGAQIQPEFPGADSSEVIPYPKISVARGDRPFSVGAHDDSFAISLLSSGGFSAGPVANIGPRRNDSDVGSPVGDVNRSFEAGGFAQYYVSENFRLRMEARKALSGHDGFVGHAGADYVTRDADLYSFSIGPRVRFADSDYMEAFYGVRPEVSIPPLTVYDPDGGIEAVGAVAGFTYSLGGPFGLFGYGRYDRLVGDAKDSPIVEIFGSPNQFSAGVGLSYTFNLEI